MTVWREGEILDITIRARVTEDSDQHHCLKVTYRQPEHLNASPYPLILPLVSPDMTIARVAPKEWPPQPGDVWRNQHGMVLFACTYAESYVQLMSSHGDAFESAAGALERVGPLELVQRKDWTPQTSPAGRDTESSPGGLPVDERAEVIAGLHELADWLAAHPQIPATDSTFRRFVLWPAHWHGGGEDEDAKAAGVADLIRLSEEIGAKVRTSTHVYGTLPPFRGVVELELIVTEAAELYRSQLAAEPGQDIAQAGEVAGSEGESEPATAAAAEDRDDDGPVDGCECEDCDDLRSEPAVAATEPVRQVVLIESPVPGGKPSRAEVCEDNGGTTVKVIYCDSRTGARVARRRILGPAPDVEPAPAPGPHTQVAAWGGGPGSNGVECSCGVTHDGFDTIAEAEALRAQHAVEASEG